jgi:hypothetical protein
MRNYSFVATSLASKFVAVPLLFAVTLIYVSRLIKQTGPEFYTIGMTAFGITAALSAICLTIPSSLDVFSPTKYAGEKFLHSSLLLIQTLMIVYVRSALMQSVWWTAHHNFANAASLALSILGSLISTAAAFAWYFGFETLNEELWSNWDRRLREMKAEKSKSKTAPADKN